MVEGNAGRETEHKLEVTCPQCKYIVDICQNSKCPRCNYSLIEQLKCKGNCQDCQQHNGNIK